MRKKEEELTEEQLATVPMLIVPAASKIDLGGDSVVQSQDIVRSRPVDDDDEDDDEDDLRATYVEEEPEEEEEDHFLPVISRMARSESPTVRDAMLSTLCFARLWYDTDDGSYCPEQECHIRPLCEKAYHKVIEALEGDFQVDEELVGVDPTKLNIRDEIDQKIDEDFIKVKGKGRSLQKRRRKGSRTPRIRRPYLDQGHQCDRFAKALWVGLGAPPSMTGKWRWVSAETPADRTRSVKQFVDRYGNGLLVNRRAGYHSYFYNGMHVLRIWVNSKKHAWCDMNPWLADAAREEDLDIELTTVKDKKHHFNFYPFRTKIKTLGQQVSLVRAVIDTLRSMAVR